MTDPDLAFDLACFLAAVQETLHRRGNLDDAEPVFLRARHLSAEGRRLGYLPFLVQPRPTPSPIQAPSNTSHKNSGRGQDLFGNTHPCPQCGEPIPTTWKTHTYKADSTPCGWTTP